MKRWVDWFIVIMNPIVIWTMVPIPLVQYGHFTWSETFELLLGYTVVWMILWYTYYQGGRKVTLGE